MNFQNLQNQIHKDINYFFDIKTYLKKKLNKKNEKILAKKIVKNFNLFKKKENNLKSPKTNKILISKKIHKKKFLSHNKKFKNKIFYILKKFDTLFFRKYFKFFLLHGSFVTDDYVENWSDIDTLVVLKVNVFKDFNILINLRERILSIYLEFLKISPFQHHGLIFVNEIDLNNYSDNFIPIEALKFNLNIFNNSKIFFKKINNKNNNNSYKNLITRLQFVKKSLKKGYYDHHVLNKKKLSVPLKENEETLKQFFCHVGFMINLPILFFTSIGKSVHKKKSFKLFYKTINDKRLITFVKKHEIFRKNWNEFYLNNYNLSKKIVNFFGKDYFIHCKNNMELLIHKINNFNKNK